MQPTHPDFHAECDVAAVVYGAADDPDAVLAAFLRDLRAQGFDAVGLLQRCNPRGPDIAGPAEFFLIPDTDVAKAYREPQFSPLRYCGAQSQDLIARLRLALVRRPDLIVLNRFGWQEACGSGLLSLLAGAIERDVPAVIAVPEALFDRWLTVAQGLAVKLRCDRASINRWWDGVRPVPSGSRPHEDFCQRYK